MGPRCVGPARAADVCMSPPVHVSRSEHAVIQIQVQWRSPSQVVAFTSVNKPGSLSLRYAVSSTEAACHWWGEDHYSEPIRPAKVHVEKSGAEGSWGGGRHLRISIRLISYDSWAIYTFERLILFRLMFHPSLCSLTRFQTELQGAMLSGSWSCYEQLSLLALLKEQVLLASVLTILFIIYRTEVLLVGKSWTFLNSYTYLKSQYPEKSHKTLICVMHVQFCFVTFWENMILSLMLWFFFWYNSIDVALFIVQLERK